MEEQQEILGFLGHDIVDASGERLGTIEGFFLDDDETARWVTAVSDGTELVVPLHGAAQSGTSLQVAMTRDAVLEAPLVDLSSSAWPTVLSEHYGVGFPAYGPPKRWP